MVRLSAKFDGKVFVPDDVVDMPRDQRVVMHVEPISSEGTKPPGKPATDFQQFVGTIDPTDLKLMSDAIEEAFGQVEPDGW